MKHIWLVRHSYSIGEHEEIKFIGAFTTKAKALAAVKKIKNKPGFRKYKRGFHIGKIKLDDISWGEGFI